MSHSIHNLANNLIGKKKPVFIGFESNSEFSFSEFSGGAKFSSYFDPQIQVVVNATPVMTIIGKINLTKKDQIKIESWGAVEIRYRFEKIKAAIREAADSIVQLEAHFQGTTKDFQNRWAIQPILNLIDELIENQNVIDQVTPKGFITAITSRSQSFFEIGQQIILSLFHKNSLLVKPATSTSLSAVLWSLLLKECDWPENIVNFVYGPGRDTGKFLMDHPGVKNIAFSGALDTLKKTQLSLEKKYHFQFNGKNAIFVLGDFDFRSHMVDLVRVLVEHNGKSVFSPARIFVLDAVEREFKDELQKCLGSLSPVDSISDLFGFLPLLETDSSLLKTKSHQFKIEEAKLIFQNDRFVIYSELANCSEMHQENLELPLYNVTSVKYTHEMARWLNNSSFGHSAIVFGSEEKSKKLILKSEVGRVVFNPKPLEPVRVNPVKMSAFGETNFNLPHCFYSYPKNI